MRSSGRYPSIIDWARGREKGKERQKGETVLNFCDGS